MSELKQTLQQIQAIRERLKELGVLVIHDDEIIDLLSDLKETRQQMEKDRSKQFWDDASYLASRIKSSKESDIAAFLRVFAEHIVTQAFNAYGVPENVTEFVDTIDPYMNKA